MFGAQFGLDHHGAGHVQHGRGGHTGHLEYVAGSSDGRAALRGGRVEREIAKFASYIAHDVLLLRGGRVIRVDIVALVVARRRR